MNMRILYAMTCAVAAFCLVAGEKAPAPYDDYLRLFNDVF